MHNFLYGYEEDHKASLNQFLAEKRSQNNFKVLDVGGSVGPWFWNNTDVIFDFIPPPQITVIFLVVNIFLAMQHFQRVGKI